MRRLRASRSPLRRASTGLRAVAALGAIVLDHLVHAHAARDHGVHVGLRVYVEVQDDATRLLLSPAHHRLDVVALAHRLSAQAVSGGESLVVRAGYRGLRVAAV